MIGGKRTGESGGVGDGDRIGGIGKGGFVYIFCGGKGAKISVCFECLGD